MTRRCLEKWAKGLFWLALTAVLASCGSGAVGPAVTDPTKITILPGADGTPAVLYSGLPTTFTITGGTGSYIVSSSNQAIVPVSGAIGGNQLTVIPSPVTTETTLTLTARDTGSTTPATVTLTVRPGTVSNNILIAPSSLACSPAICSGGDAVVAATLSQGGIPLPARGVRFDVISGDVRFITSPAGSPETVGLSVTTVTDETGVARARVRALDTAENQTAIIQITDLGSGAYQRTTLFVARATSTQTGFFTVPNSITFTGVDTAHCASSGNAEVFVFGGTPPYTIANSAPTAFALNTSTVSASGGSFRVTPTGTQCVDNAAVAVTDAAGRTTTVTLSNKVGTAPVVQALQVSPASLSLDSCSAVASAVIIGGTGSYVAASGSSLVIASVSGGLLSVSRRPATDATAVTSVSVTVGDGKTTSSVSVRLQGAAAGPC